MLLYPTLFICLLFIPGAYCIEVSFSASEGSDSVSIVSIYRLDDSASASESVSANFGPVGISDTRSLSGAGGIRADQSYSGSGGYKGSAIFSTDGSGSLTGTASLTANSLSANQDVSATGSLSSAEMSLTNGDTVGVSLQLVDGSLTSFQSLSTGSAHASSSSHIVGSFTSSTYSSGSLINRNNIPYVFESVDLYQNSWAPGISGAFDYATFNVNPQTKIQPSVDWARPFDKVSAGPGIFNENVDVWKSLTIQGAGAGSTIVDGGNKGSVFTVDSGVNALISGMAIRDGTGTDDRGGGIYNLGTLTVDSCSISDNAASYGGGIYNKGDLTISDSIISSNTVKDCGGGIYNHKGSTTTIRDSTTSHNYAGWGGGIFNAGMATVIGGTINGNVATGGDPNNGGGIYNMVGTIIVNDATISDNLAGDHGGGIYNYKGITIVTDGTISRNTATFGGGIFNYFGTTTVNGGFISSNTAAEDGGGIENSYGTTIINGGTITSNIAACGAGIVNLDMTVINGGTISGNAASDNGGGIYNDDILKLYQYQGQKISIKKNSAGIDGGGFYNTDTIIPDYSNCDFGTGADRNTPNDHN